jgi:hypothetical protein
MAQHPLRKYLLARKHPHGLQAARREFAERIGCHPDSVRNIDSSLKRPGWPLALRIEEKTQGVVKAEKIMRAPVRESSAKDRAA